jgi:hypothetical protein
MADIRSLFAPIRRLHDQIRAAVVDATEQTPLDQLARVSHESEGDTIYAVDRVSEDLIVDFFAREVADESPLILIAEGLPGGQIALPYGISSEEAVWRVIVDPIDGTRGIMYQKRSAWILTGVAPNRGPHTNLQDIEFAIQTEIPLVKQHLSDVVWAFHGQGVSAERINRLTGDRVPLPLQPSGAQTIAHGFAQISRFFPGAREVLAAIDDEIVTAALGPVQFGKAHSFEDQYVSTAGQFYELMAGHDRFVADLRPLMEKVLTARGHPLGICSHPYDVCTELVARECGVIITDPWGNPLQATLGVVGDIAWAGYANRSIRAQIEPLLQGALHRRGLSDGGVLPPNK